MEVKFDTVWGQSTACSVLSRSIQRKRVACAYLFSGPSGLGKTLTAGIFARALLCESRDELPCGLCRSCKMLFSESHPDFIPVAPDGTMIKIEQARALISSLSMKSYGGKRKVCVMESAEKMNRETANSLLKTLEEPPPDTVLILVSSNPAALLPTIISRCRAVRFAPILPEKLAEMLETKKSFSREEALLAANLAEGRPGRALGGEVDQIKRLDDEARQLFDGITDMKPEEVIKFAEGWKKRRDDLPIFIDRLTETLRFSAQANLRALSATMAAGDSPEGVLQGRLLRGFEELLDAKPGLRFNPNAQLFMESVILNLQSILVKGESLAGGYY